MKNPNMKNLSAAYALFAVRAKRELIAIGRIVKCAGRIKSSTEEESLMKRLIVLFFVFFSPIPVYAGRYVVRWEAKVNIEVEPLAFDEKGDAWIGVVALPATGRNRAGRAEMRIDGVVVKFFEAPPYRFEIPLDQAITLPAVKGQEKVKGPFKVGVGHHLIEFYLISIDGRGREVRNGDAAGSAKFWIEAAQDREAIEKADTQFQQIIQNLKDELRKTKEEYERLKNERDEQAAELTAKQREREQAYEQEIADHKRRIGELEKLVARPTPTQKEGVIVVTGKPDQSVKVECSVDGRLIRQFSFNFSDKRLITDFRLPVSEKEIVVSATFTSPGETIQLDRDNSNQPLKLTSRNLSIYFAGYEFSKMVKEAK